MKVVVVGASGFLGSWLTYELAKFNDVIALGREKTNFWRLSCNERISIGCLPVELWAELIIHEDPDVLVFADWSGVAGENRNSIEQFENVSRWRNVLVNYRGKNLKTVIGLGSQAELGPVSGSILESAPDNPTTIYGQAKVEGRHSLESICNDLNLRFVWMRIFSTYGPLDNGNWLIPNLVDSLNKKRVMLLTLGEQEWSYLHAYDFANAVQMVIENEFLAGVVNVGNQNTLSIREVANKVGNYFDSVGLLEFGAVPYRQDQVMELRPVCESLTDLGWNPKIDFDQGLTQTIEWLLGKEIGPLITQNGYRLDFRVPIRPKILRQR